MSSLICALHVMSVTVLYLYVVAVVSNTTFPLGAHKVTLSVPPDSLEAPEMAKFHAPVIQDNPSGWGPCAVPDKFKDMPYQPFSKGDRLGKVRLSVLYLGHFGDWLFSFFSFIFWCLESYSDIGVVFLQVADWTGATYQDKRYTSKKVQD